ncbi:hypothetical protein HG530_007137 [Fusarium avenaceum]|nr:hypothetical protein HG530_007137 [Fusarium avenaceum]
MHLVPKHPDHFKQRLEQRQRGQLRPRACFQTAQLGKGILNDTRSSLNNIINVLLRDNERRADEEVVAAVPVHAVETEAVREGHLGLFVGDKLDGPEEASATDVADVGHGEKTLLELRTEVLAHGANARYQVLVTDDLLDLESGGGCLGMGHGRIQLRGPFRQRGYRERHLPAPRRGVFRLGNKGTDFLRPNLLELIIKLLRKPLHIRILGLAMLHATGQRSEGCSVPSAHACDEVASFGLGNREVGEVCFGELERYFDCFGACGVTALDNWPPVDSTRKSARSSAACVL